MSCARHLIGGRWTGAALLASCVVLLAGCGGSSSGPASTGSASSEPASESGPEATASVQESGGCGTLPPLAPDDPDGVLRGLGSDYVAAYEGFRDYPLSKSAWENWKPRRTSDWNVQVVWVPLNAPYPNAVLEGLQDELEASGKVSSIQVQAPNTNTDVAAQVQMIQTAISRKPDLLIVFPLAGNAVVQQVEKAAEAGIPTISASTAIASEHAVSLIFNVYLSEGLSAAGMLELMGGEGDLLVVHGVKGHPNDVAAIAALDKARSRCPDVKVAGEVEGRFDNTTAKGAVQQFLATRPAGVQGVFQIGVMGPGVLGAFAQTGRTPPPMGGNVEAQGTLAYWHDHPDYDMVASLAPDRELGEATATVALRMLEGDGVKVNTLVGKPYIVTRANLDEVWKPTYEEGSALGASPPPGEFMPESYLDGFFARGAAK